MLTSDPGNFTSDGHSRMSLHATTLPRAMADIWAYQGPYVMLPPRAIAAGADRRVTTEENLNAPMCQYNSPNKYEKVIYDDGKDHYDTSEESGDWA